jgi:hypothetical protein
MRFFCWSRMAFGLGFYLSSTTGFLHVGPFRLGFVSTLEPKLQTRCSLP